MIYKTNDIEIFRSDNLFGIKAILISIRIDTKDEFFIRIFKPRNINEWVYTLNDNNKKQYCIPFLELFIRLQNYIKDQKAIEALYNYIENEWIKQI